MALIGSITEGNSLVGSLNATGNLEGAIVGAKGDPGEPGEKGDPGETGNGIASITKTSSSGLVDTYTITYTDGTTTTFTVTNGADGQAGQDGQDGADGADGYSPSASVSKSGDTATVTITDKNGTTTATITDGQDGADGQDGQDGQDGHTPVITASKTGKVTTVYVDGTAVATINDGQDGAGSVADVTQNGVSVLDGTTAKVTVPTNVSDLNNDSGFITTETDPTVPSWAKQSTKPTYTANEVGALPSTTQIPSKTSDLTNDSGFITGMEILSYGNSTWNDFITAYTAQKVVYCRASSNSNPATGTQGRLAFMAYVNNATAPTEVEFQYYRSVSSHSASQQGDQVFVYKLTSAGTWTVTTREASSKIATGTGLTSSYSSGTLTLSSTVTVDTITVTLTVAGWSSDAQTVTATGVTSSNTVIVSPSPSDMEDYTDAGIVCTAQGTNSLTFSCDTTPTSAIDVNVVII